MDGRAGDVVGGVADVADVRGVGVVFVPVGVVDGDSAGDVDARVLLDGRLEGDRLDVGSGECVRWTRLGDGLTTTPTAGCAGGAGGRTSRYTVIVTAKTTASTRVDTRTGRRAITARVLSDRRCP